MNTKICFKSDGNLPTGAKIIAALEKLGGRNSHHRDGSACSYYYIDNTGTITYGSMPMGYTLVDINTYKHEEQREQPTEFTVEGSSALLEAFVKECGCPLGRNNFSTLNSFIHPPITEYLLFTDIYKGITITSWDKKRSTHFILPNDWNKVMPLAKDFFKPKQFVPKLNTWVWIEKPESKYTCNALVYYVGKVPTFGFNLAGEWCTAYAVQNVEPERFLRQATDDEVGNALIEEAKKRGFKMGVNALRSKELLDAHNTPHATNHVVLCDDNFVYSSERHCITLDGRIIYCKGLWADIIHDNKITVAGIEFKCENGTLHCIHGDIVIDYLRDILNISIGKHNIMEIKIGCAVFTRSQLSDLYEFCRDK